jgi:hypothetical protein
VFPRLLYLQRASYPHLVPYLFRGTRGTVGTSPNLLRKSVDKAVTPRVHRGWQMSDTRKSEDATKIRASWSGKLGKWRDPPPPARSEEAKTSRPPFDSSPAGDTRRVDLQLRGTERALDDARDEIDRLRGQLLASRREAEALRMTLAQAMTLVSRDSSTP